MSSVMLTINAGGNCAMSDTAERVKKTIAEYLSLEPDAVTEEANFTEDFEMDSLAMMELVIAFEEEFAIEIGDASLDQIISVGDAVTTIDALRGAGKQVL